MPEKDKQKKESKEAKAQPKEEIVDTESEDIFANLEVTDASMSQFYKPAKGKNAICLVNFPAKPTEVTIDGATQLKLHVPIIASVKGKKVLRTWSVNYKQRTGSSSLLAQVADIRKTKAIENWAGVVLELTRTGEGRQAKYALNFVKKLAEVDFKKQLEEATKNSEEEGDEEEKPVEDVDSLFK